MSFTLDLSRFAKKATASADTIVRKVIIEMFTKVIMKTPVDTGHLRWNWVASYGTYHPQELVGLDKATATVAKATSIVISNKVGGIYYLVNSLPYVRRIEYEGWSKVKAPQGMLRISIQETKAKYA